MLPALAVFVVMIVMLVVALFPMSDDSTRPVVSLMAGRRVGLA